ncbi:MAG: thiamine pyrophosphate-binding protein [Candidatus Omnitrophica bacterium]|nr:thiamine pyrophosphate-binding protein [Candidatus Omnitrophota bacterium]
MSKKHKSTIGTYLIKRLEQAGLKHIFGVPGDYVLEFFRYLEESRLKVVCNCNELNAGYAADAYARMNGISAVCVTYGVGGYSLFNAVVGAFAERIPMVVISGAPRVFERSHHHLLHHTTGDINLQYNMYEKITVSSCVLVNPEQAPEQIDKTIAACLKFKRPVYIEIPIDVISMPCPKPGPFSVDTTITSDKACLDEAVSETLALLEQAKRPVALVGVESHRLGIRRQLQELVEHTGYPFASGLLGRTVIPEEHPQFVGVYGGYASWESARKAVQEADIILCLGTIMTDIQIGGSKALLDPGRMIVANSDKVRIKHHIYNHVGLKDFMVSLKSRMKKHKPVKISPSHCAAGMTDGDYRPRPGHKITVKRFYQRMNRFIDQHSLVIGESGDSIFNVATLSLPKGVSCIGQAFYLSIGFATPAALGAALAAPKSRVVAFIGDGAFQMTAQEVSTIIREKLNPIIFLMNNDGYTIERVMVDGAFNDLQGWKYSKLPSVFGGGWGCAVKTEGDLEAALKRAADRPAEFALIEVILDRMDCAEATRMYGAKYKAANISARK